MRHTGVEVLVLVLVAALAGPAAAVAPGAPAPAPVTCHGHPVTIHGTAGGDVLTGTPGVDVIAGLAGDDRLVGLGGDDLLCGGRGADTLDGGPGDDRLWGGPDRVSAARNPVRHGDGLTGGPGDDLLVAGADPRVGGLPGSPDLVSWADADRGVRVDLTRGRADGEGHDVVRLVGGVSLLSDHDDTFVGTDGADTVHAGDGDDVLATGPGPDVVHLDTDESPGDDRVRAGAGQDEVRGLGGRDRVRAGPGRDYVELSGFGTPWILAGPGIDVVRAVVAAVPDQSVDGGAGRDHLFLSVGTDGDHHRFDLASGAMYVGTAATPVLITGFERHDLLDGHWELTGTRADDEVAVNAGSSFAGLGGDDRFVGSPDDDTFDGGAGVDSYLRDAGGVNGCTSVEHDPSGACGTP